MQTGSISLKETGLEFEILYQNASFALFFKIQCQILPSWAFNSYRSNSLSELCKLTFYLHMRLAYRFR